MSEHLSIAGVDEFRIPDKDAPARFSADNKQAVRESLDDYIGKFNCGRLQQIFDNYRKPNIQLPFDGSLIACSQIGKNQMLDSAEIVGTRFYLDGDYTIAVGLQPEDEEPVWFGVVGFFAGNRLRRYSDLRREKFGTDSIVVVQIQGSSKPQIIEQTERIEQARHIFQTFQTEFALLSLTVEWAHQAGLNTIYALPAAKNKWMPSKRAIEQNPETKADLALRLKNRYDGTASRFGFQKGPFGFYQLSLE